MDAIGIFLLVSFKPVDDVGDTGKSIDGIDSINSSPPSVPLGNQPEYTIPHMLPSREHVLDSATLTRSELRGSLVAIESSNPLGPQLVEVEGLPG